MSNDFFRKDNKLFLKVNYDDTKRPHYFLCIHPFANGNGRMSRLLSLLLLYKNGFDVGKYISF